MKKYLSYGFVLGTLAVSGITPAIISSNNLGNTIQKNSDLNTKAAGDPVAPTIDSFEWTAGSSATEEDFTISLSDPGSHDPDSDGVDTEFDSNDFDASNSKISYEDSGLGSNDTDFNINNWKYTDAADNNDSDNDQITGTVKGLTEGNTYDGIILTLAYSSGTSPNKDTHQFTSDGDSADLDISNTNGESFTREILPSFTLADDTEWDDVSDDSAEITLSEVDWGTDAGGNAYTEKDLNSDLSYVAYDDSAKEEMPYEDVNLALKDSDDENNTVVLELSNLDSDTEYNISSIHLIFGNSEEEQYDSMVDLGNNDEIPALTTEESSLSGGAIFGIVLGSLIVVGLIAYLIYYFIAKNKKDNDLTKEETQV